MEEQQEALPGGPLANYSLSFSVHKIGMPFTVELKTFVKVWVCLFHLGAGFGSFGLGFYLS